MIAIEKGVPVPEVIGSRRGGNTTKYPFGDLEVGHSFAVPADLEAKIRSAAWHHGKRTDKRFTCEVRDENGQRVVRVWRVE